jgi:phage pi2 protein 07
MRLHSNEHQDIMELLERAGLADTLLTKKSGWVHIKLGTKTFSFHRKKVTRLVDGKFTDSFEYYIGTPKKPQLVNGWNEVVVALQASIENH